VGANDRRHGATASHVQPSSLRRNGTSGHAGRRLATLRDCLLSSRSRVRVAVGAQVRSLELSGRRGWEPKRYAPAMSETTDRRRGHGEDGIYLDAARNRYMGAVSLGYGPDGKRIRRNVSGKTKQEVRAKLQALHQELNAGVRSSRTYTVRETVEDWLREGLGDTSERTRTLYEGLLEPVLEMIGARPLRDLSAGDVRSPLGKLVTRYSTRSLQITRNSLERATQRAFRGLPRSGVTAESGDDLRMHSRAVAAARAGPGAAPRGRAPGRVARVRFPRATRPGCRWPLTRSPRPSCATAPAAARPPPPGRRR
jgi:hypothetical protein